MTSEPSVSTIIGRLKQGDPNAAEQLWIRYFDKLVNAARRKLGSTPKRAFDEHDIAISVFDSLCRGAARGNFKQLTDRDDLWALLLAITKQKSVDRIRHEQRMKRGGGKVRGESVFARANDGSVALRDGSVALRIDQLVRDDIGPDLLVELEEQRQKLLHLLQDDNMRKVARMRMDGYSVSEIAEECSFTTRWVERKLELIRKRWAQELPLDGEDE